MVHDNIIYSFSLNKTVNETLGPSAKFYHEDITGCTQIFPFEVVSCLYVLHTHTSFHATLKIKLKVFFCFLRRIILPFPHLQEGPVFPFVEP